MVSSLGSDFIDRLTPTEDQAPSDKCHLCSKPIEGADAQVIERVVGFQNPRHYAQAGVQTYSIRRHFIDHAA